MKCAVRLCVSGALACLGLVGVAPSPAPPSLDDVLARVREARGKRPPAERVVTDFVRGDASGNTIEVRSGANFRVDETDGPFHSAYGSADGTGWSLNDNGELQEAPPTTDAENAQDGDRERTDATLSFDASSGRYVLSRLTQLGFGTKDYVDPATWHVVRRDRIEAGGTTTSTYADFHVTAGYARPWQTTVDDGHPENHAVYTVRSDDTNPIAANLLAEPAEPPPFVTFPGGVSNVQLPVAYDRDDGKFIVHVTIAGHVLPFLLDSGANGILIGTDTVRSLRLKTYGTYSSGVNAGRFVGGRTLVPAVGVGPLAMRDVQMDVAPFEKADGPYAFVGILGFDFIDAVALQLDYGHGSAYAFPTDGYLFPNGPHAIDLELRFAEGEPETSLTINGAAGDRFILDTGGAGAVLITDLFARNHSGAVLDANGGGVVTTLSGVGGSFGARYVKLASMTLGNATFTDFSAFVVNEAKVFSFGADGLIGPDLFRLYTVYFDYHTREARLIPNSVGMSGITPNKSR